MSGDYTRFTFKPRNRYSNVLQQQGRVQLDSDWNEAVAIIKHRARAQAEDTFGKFGVPPLTNKDAFWLAISAGPDLSIKPGRIYVDGLLVELFDDDKATYKNQPYFPNPPDLPGGGDAVVYLDVWEREVTYVEDPLLLDDALGGADTATRTQTVWQLKFDPHDNATCGLDVGDPPSQGLLTTQAVSPPDPNDPCLLPPIGGYRGLENRLYRVEIQTPGILGAAKFKWSRDNGSIVSGITDISTDLTTLTVKLIGRDQYFRFNIGDWVTITDDDREFHGEPGEMAQIVDIDEVNNRIVLDRAMPSSGPLTFGADKDKIAARHTRIQRWDETAAKNPVIDLTTGLMATGAGPIDIEDGIQVSFATKSPTGEFRVGDYWTFWARTATARIEILDQAPPRGIKHHYVQLAAMHNIATSDRKLVNCRPETPEEDCCCTKVVAPGAPDGAIQKAIDELSRGKGGCVCLKTGTHTISTTIKIVHDNIKLVGESPGTVVQINKDMPALQIGSLPLDSPTQNVEISTIRFERLKPGDPSAVVEIYNAREISILDCGVKDAPLGPIKSVEDSSNSMGIEIVNAGDVSIARCNIETAMTGIHVSSDVEGFLRLQDNVLDLSAARDKKKLPAVVGILVQDTPAACFIEGNMISGALMGIIINNSLTGPPASSVEGPIVARNIVFCELPPQTLKVDTPLFGIDVAAGYSIVAENLVHVSALGVTNGGIRITGAKIDVVDNEVRFDMDAILGGPTGIAIGYYDETSPVITSEVRAAGNTINRCSLGIAVSAAQDVIVESNMVNVLGDIDDPSSSAGIAFSRVQDGQIQNNHIHFGGIAILCMMGERNRVTANSMSDGGFGINIALETGPAISQNRIQKMSGWGVSLIATLGRCDVIENRIVSCGLITGAGIVAYIVLGELHIEANEVMDTGVPAGGKPQLSQRCFGIWGALVLEARVESNLVTYSNLADRVPIVEDRALWMMGLIDVELGLHMDKIWLDYGLGFSIQILGNKFFGPGQSALVELAQLGTGTDQIELANPDAYTGLLYFRFDRVIFSHNYCEHLVMVGDESIRALIAEAGTQPGGTPGNEPPPKATVLLVGRAASVMGNHIRAVGIDTISSTISLMAKLPFFRTIHAFPSVDFNRVSGPFVGNVISGPVKRQGTAHALDAHFNMTI
jgi:hypothetical protein